MGKMASKVLFLSLYTKKQVSFLQCRETELSELSLQIKRFPKFYNFAVPCLLKLNFDIHLHRIKSGCEDQSEKFKYKKY